jgi:hypothetical protein
MKNLVLTSLLFLFAGSVLAQLSLAPTAIYMDKNGVGNLFVTNSSSTPQEINISHQFGYVDQDENGVLIMVYDDSARASLHALDKVIKAFPRSFILPPNQQQIVRFQVRMPKDAKPGMYFTRIKVASSGQVADVGGENAEASGVSTRVNLRFEQVLACFYKHIEVSTGLLIDRVQSRLDSNLLTLDAYYRTTGNAPFLGKVKVLIKAPDGSVISEFSQSMAMYFTGRRRFKVRLPEDVKPGSYQVEFTFLTERSDIAQEDLVQAPPFTHKATIRIG